MRCCIKLDFEKYVLFIIDKEKEILGSYLIFGCGVWMFIDVNVFIIVIIIYLLLDIVYYFCIFIYFIY